MLAGETRFHRSHAHCPGPLKLLPRLVSVPSPLSRTMNVMPTDAGSASALSCGTVT